VLEQRFFVSPRMTQRKVLVVRAEMLHFAQGDKGKARFFNNYVSPKNKEKCK